MITRTLAAIGLAVLLWVGWNWARLTWERRARLKP